MIKKLEYFLETIIHIDNDLNNTLHAAMLTI